MVIESPKQTGSTMKGPGWYRYYAGYSEAFVESIIKQLPLTGSSVVLDPWNGAGTTTAVASRLGYSSIGLDINPALVVVARARLLGRDVLPSIIPLSRDVINKSKASKRGRIGDAALSPWFSPRTATTIASYIDSICTLLTDKIGRKDLFYGGAVNEISSLASLFLVSIFDVVRGGIQSAITSNPTWVKPLKSASDKVDWDRYEVEKRFTDCLSSLCKYVIGRPEGGACGYSEITLGKAQEISRTSADVDIAIASPPYCTRIDYVISSWPELAVLGAQSRSDLKALRDSTTGSPTTVPLTFKDTSAWGDTANDFLDKLSRHPSKASQTYYTRFYSKYFSDISDSLKRLNNIVSANANLFLVVQGSNYKELNIDLPKIISEMSVCVGWTLNQRTDFHVKNNMAKVRYSALGKDIEPVNKESVLHFSKA